MEILTSALIIICICLIGANIYMMLRNKSLQANIEESHKAIKVLAKDNRNLLNADLMLGKKVTEIEKTVERLESRQDKHTTTTAGASDSTYNQAIALLNRGASIDEVIQQFGLCRAEAELLDSLKTGS